MAINDNDYEKLLTDILKSVYEIITKYNQGVRNVFDIQQQMSWLFSDFFENICFIIHYNPTYIQNYIKQYLENNKIDIKIKDDLDKIKKQYALSIKIEDRLIGRAFAKKWWQENKEKIERLENAKKYDYI
jgi:hypothetical protein